MMKSERAKGDVTRNVMMITVVSFVLHVLMEAIVHACVRA